MTSAAFVLAPPLPGTRVAATTGAAAIRTRRATPTRAARMSSSPDTSDAALYSSLRQRGAVLGDTPKPNAELSPQAVVATLLRALQHNHTISEGHGCAVFLSFAAPEYLHTLEKIVTYSGYIDDLNPRTVELYLRADGQRTMLLEFSNFEFLGDVDIDVSAQRTTATQTVLLCKNPDQMAKVSFSLIKDTPSAPWMVADVGVLPLTVSDAARIEARPQSPDPEAVAAAAERRKNALADLPDGPAYPDVSLSPLEVANAIVVAFAKNDTPYKDHGAEVLLRFAGPEYIETLTRFVTQNGLWDTVTVENVAQLIRAHQRLWVMIGFHDYGFRNEAVLLEDGTVEQDVYILDAHDVVRRIVFALGRDMERSKCWLVRDVRVHDVSQAELNQMME
mmetsp:Transcript_31828/g.77902  ORF Transcript_31828/g.77902 Transcript_31828/m.77902 type:complete len:391 (+) Transcript_31828:149-1321(+)|eukprot:CAMPEP_0198333448 /NCGR_PEP_ID=MMETSP1450-20131203/18959_1 /TAXON_ID=753684 ORGANISM="Madagascaria erythrocladiodes, Strain CCMP3234" /NCGR_SAMPLE_ID=MMETSP1450 /ASSEMBLY_ACC=CAM_ASM_001115 /LENGTH=390 /DNA_ID=CAMNT_0044037967 /DNA_START=133 /DNA_END=1305 /DNA_ORIENTATION=+